MSAGALLVIGISPLIDFAFKLVFGSPEHTRITIHFLNSVLKLASPINSITIRNPFLGKIDENDKLSILDILAEDQHGRRFNIEMQTTLPAGMNQRLLYHGARIYGGQITEGDNYIELRSAIVVCVLEKPLFPRVDQLHMDFRMRDDAGRTLSEDLQVHLLQLSKLTVTAQNVSSASLKEQWAYFMVNVDKMTAEEIRRLLPDEVFTEAAGVLEMISKTPDQRMEYDARLKFRMDQASLLEQARLDALQIIDQERDKARVEGRLEGRLEGRVEGLAEGREVGRAEGELLGRIRTYQELLGIDPSSGGDLSTLDQTQLTKLAAQLRAQLRN